jgi:hypothetical protein
MNSKSKGDVAELYIAAVLIDSGYTISKPLGENQAYDLVVDSGIKLLRLQCKYITLKKNGIIAIAKRTCDARSVVLTPYSSDNVDAFAVYCPTNKQIYYVRIGEFTTNTSISLRIEPPKNKQTYNIRLASDYLDHTRLWK